MRCGAKLALFLPRENKNQFISRLFAYINVVKLLTFLRQYKHVSRVEIVLIYFNLLLHLCE